VNVEQERAHFACYDGFTRAEESLRFKALGIKDNLKQRDVELWLDSGKHAKCVSDLRKVVEEILLEEAIEEN